MTDDCVQWRCDLAEEATRAKRSRRVAERDEKCTHIDAWSKDFIPTLKKGMFFLRNPPAAVLPQTKEAA